MILALWLWGAAAGVAPETLVKQNVGDLSLKAPKEWPSKDSDEGNGQSRSFDGGDAQLELSVFAVDPRRDPKVCLEQLLKALDPNGYEQLKVGGQPAARKVTTDFVGQSEAAKTEANKVSTVSYVGCNGSTKWVLTMTSRVSKSPRYGPLLKRIIDSLSYSK